MLDMNLTYVQIRAVGLGAQPAASVPLLPALQRPSAARSRQSMSSLASTRTPGSLIIET
jgi:hypothetical protein